MESLGKMTKRTRYGGEGVVGFGLDYACAHIIILAEISSENLLPIRADFVTERAILRRTQSVWLLKDEERSSAQKL